MKDGRRIKVGSRCSPLAIWQVEYIIGLMTNGLYPSHDDVFFDICGMTTYGDINQEPPLEPEATGVFTKELDRALLAGEIDMSVHSLKDVATSLPPGLIIKAVAPRGDFRDALVSKKHRSIESLPRGARLGTGSPRRMAQLKRFRNDLEFIPIRGNVETRLRKMDELGLDGLILAAAGLERLGLAELISERISPDVCLPAPGQGAICVEIWSDGLKTGFLSRLLEPVNDKATSLATAAERRFLSAVGGGCKAAVGTLGEADADGRSFVLKAVILDADGRNAAEGCVSGPASEMDGLVDGLAERLLEERRT